ncbi:MAG: response regulator transcription factor [Clostridia bacterium]|nr:response regulator transcription factor [Clostridia bacterium]
MAKILVADDEQLIRKLIGDCLRKDGHTVLEAEDGEKALALFRQNSDVALALLDIMMPGIDGWQVCREIRKTSGIPVMLVSARSQDFDQIMGFESGADDYVTKPFSLAVLQQRINTLLRRGARPVEEKAEPDTLTLDGLKIRTSAYEAELNGKPLELTLKEFNILTKLVSNPGRVFSRDGILNDVWGIDYVGDTRTVDSHMARLRTKLGDWGTNHIKTVYGIGYKVDKN